MDDCFRKMYLDHDFTTFDQVAESI